MSARAFTGTIKTLEIKIQPPFNRFQYWGGNTDEIFVFGSIELQGGITAYFKKMCGTHSIRSGGPFAINLYMVSDEGKGWVTEFNADKSVASPGVQARNRLALNFQAGDTISLSARVKGEEKVSRKGNRYVSLTHVKLQGCLVKEAA